MLPRNIHKEIADKIKVALDDEIKMLELEVELRERGYSKAADTIDHFKIQFMELQVVPCRALEKD